MTVQEGAASCGTTMAWTRWRRLPRGRSLAPGPCGTDARLTNRVGYRPVATSALVGLRSGNPNVAPEIGFSVLRAGDARGPQHEWTIGLGPSHVDAVAVINARVMARGLMVRASTLARGHSSIGSG